MAALALAVALSIAWAGAWASFGNYSYLYLASQPASVLAIVLTTLFWWVTRRRPRTVRSVGRFSAVAAGCLYLALCGLHFARKPPTRFDFLGGREMSFASDPGVPGFFGAVYSFPENPDTVMTIAATELASKGYRAERESGLLRGYLDTSTPEMQSGISIEISPGRATGQHWVVDGDMVDFERRDDWVLVDIVEPDIVPFWIRALLP